MALKEELLLSLLLPTVCVGDFASTATQKNESSQRLKWDLAGGGTLRSVVVMQREEQNPLEINHTLYRLATCAGCTLPLTPCQPGKAPAPPRP